MDQPEIFTYIQKQYPTYPDTITQSGYPVTIFKNSRTAAPYVIFYQPDERTTFMEAQAEPDMIGNYIEMYHLAPAKHMDQKHWLAVPLDGSVSDSKVLDLLDMSYDLVDGQAEADGETGTDRQTGADGQATDSPTVDASDNSADNARLVKTLQSLANSCGVRNVRKIRSNKNCTILSRCAMLFHERRGSVFKIETLLGESIF